MPDFDVQPLPQAHRRLLQRFYREHGSAMRPSGEAALWVAREAQIVAGLSLTPVATGHWLTGLFVAPSRRGCGVATALVEAALSGVQGPVWLFCEPRLTGFYEPLGFRSQAQLPEALGSRLQRYQRSKTLVALQRDPG